MDEWMSCYLKVGGALDTLATRCPDGGWQWRRREPLSVLNPRPRQSSQHMPPLRATKQNPNNSKSFFSEALTALLNWHCIFLQKLKKNMCSRKTKVNDNNNSQMFYDCQENEENIRWRQAPEACPQPPFPVNWPLSAPPFRTPASQPLCSLFPQPLSPFCPSPGSTVSTLKGEPTSKGSVVPSSLKSVFPWETMKNTFWTGQKCFITEYSMSTFPPELGKKIKHFRKKNQMGNWKEPWNQADRGVNCDFTQ